MKKSSLLLLLIMSFGLVRCLFLSKKIYYTFENNGGKFEFHINEDDSVHCISIWAMELQKHKEPLGINFIFSEKTPHVEKFHSFETSLFYFDKQNNKVELSPESELKIEYFNGTNIITQVSKNNTSDLQKLVNWKEVNYSYEFLGKQYEKQNNVVTYTLSYKYQPEEYPNTLHFKLKLLWENESREYITKMIQKEYDSPKINPKF